MPLTKNFKSTIMLRAKKDKKFCEAMLSEAINELLSGDVNAGKAILRDYSMQQSTLHEWQVQAIQAGLDEIKQGAVVDFNNVKRS